MAVAVKAIGESSEKAFRFIKAKFGEENGLYYMRARYYSPEIGRFISKDPIGLAGGINMYSYVGNSPLNFADPWGLDAWSGAGDTVGGFLFIYGRATTYGWVTNWSTGEKCYIEVIHNRIGVGLGGGVTANSIYIANGPRAGQDLNGRSISFGVEGGFTAYVSGTPGGSIGVTEGQCKSAVATGGAGYGAGFAEYADISTTRVLWCESPQWKK